MKFEILPPEVALKERYEAGYNLGYKTGYRDAVTSYWHKLITSPTGGPLPMTFEEALGYLNQRLQDVQSKKITLDQREAVLQTKTEVCDPMFLAELKMQISEQNAEILDLKSRLMTSEKAVEITDLSWKNSEYKKDREIQELREKIDYLNEILAWGDENNC
jgi:hypothetical protein